MNKKLVKSALSDIKAYRLKQGLNQSEFWGSLGVTQSGGSRYESGRNIPVPVRALIALAVDGVSVADAVAIAKT